MHTVTQKLDGENSGDDVFEVFTASTSRGLKTLELRVNDKIVNVFVGSGASYNLILEHGGKDS